MQTWDHNTGYVRLPCNAPKAQSGEFHSQDIRILPMPVPKFRANRNLKASEFHSAWGEWYLGLWKGTENIELATEIINTMISSRWQINSSITGAGLPIYQQFFDEFGEARCFGSSDLTFTNVRDYLYGGAFSRGDFSEYRFTMQRFYAAAMTILNQSKANTRKLWDDTVARIEAWSRGAPTEKSAR